jgi:tetratricopeptide (TPR) repeat protein
MAKRKAVQDLEIDVQEVQASSQPIWEKYPNLLFYVLGGIAILIGAWFGYKTLVVEPKQKEAEAAMWQAQFQFERDSFNMALNDPGGGYDGFLTLVDKYNGTNAGNAARYYAGVCYLQMGDFDNAIQFMESFKPAGDLLPIMKFGVLGDCYSEKEDYSKALDYYEKAANAGNNDLLSIHYLKKVGLLNEHQGNKEAALKAYKSIKEDFVATGSADWREIDKYINRVSK